MKRILTFLRSHVIAIVMTIALSLPMLAQAARYFEHFDAKRDVYVAAVFDDDGNWMFTCYVQDDHCMILIGDDRMDIYL